MKKKLMLYNGAVFVLCILYTLYCAMQIDRQSQGVIHARNGWLQFYSYKVCIMNGLFFLMVMLIPDILYLLYRCFKKSKMSKGVHRFNRDDKE